MRQTTTWLLLLFFQIVAGTLHGNTTTCSLLQTGVARTKENVANGFQTRLSTTATGKKGKGKAKQDLGLKLGDHAGYKKLRHGRCDGGHRMSGKIADWSQARAKCDSDPNCAGIQNGFKLCSVGTVIVYDNARLKNNGTVRAFLLMKDGFENRFQWGKNSTKDRAAAEGNYVGQSGPISCDAQHLGGRLEVKHSKMTLAKAQMECDKRHDCAAVFDEDCDNYGNFLFCKVGFQIMQAQTERLKYGNFNDCIYTKQNRNNIEADEEVQAEKYTIHTDKQCDVHHTQSESQEVWWKRARDSCNKDPTCSGIYDTMCNGKGFVLCSEGFTLIPTVMPDKGCVYTKPKWKPVMWTKSSTGCKCYFNETRTDCACCHDGACQCSKSAGANRCAPCNAMQKCIMSEDLSDFPDLLQKVSPTVLARLNDVLDATTYESRQSGIRGFLKAAYDLPSSTAKVQAVALLDSKLNREHSGDAPFEFPNEAEVEEWLTSWFLEDEIWEHAKNVDAANQTRKEPIKGLLSRGALIQEKFQKCDWHTALHAFYATQGGYGNWCGKMPPGRPGDNNHMISYGACNEQDAKKGSWGLQVCKDSGFDESCSRHDQGAYTTNIFGIATMSLCKVDADFKAVRAKLNIESTFEDGMKRKEADSIIAANCLFDMMPCMRFEEKTYWDWCSSWSGGYPCKRTKVGYITHWPMGDYSQFKDDACGPPGCYSQSRTKEH